MSSVPVYDEIKTLLQGAFPAAQFLDFDEIDWTTPQGVDAFFVLEEAPGNEALVGFGAETNLLNREDGIIVLHCLTPAPEGSGAARAIADNARDVLRPYVSPTLRIIATGPPDLEFSNDGLWASAATAITYQRDFNYSR